MNAHRDIDFQGAWWWRFASAEAILVLAARGEPGLEAAAANCGARGATVLTARLNTGEAADAAALAERAVARFGHIDIW